MNSDRHFVSQFDESSKLDGVRLNFVERILGSDLSGQGTNGGIGQFMVSAKARTNSASRERTAPSDATV
jgi:hypothetical protein